MRFRQDWLKPVVTVPYVPTLGAVHPGVVTAALFDAVASVAGTGRFLPYDRDQRWLAVKDEQVLATEVIHQPGLTIIPAVSTRGHGMLKIYHYGDGQPDMAAVGDLARKWSITYGAQATRVIWTQDHPDGASTRVMLKTYTPADQQPHDPRVTDLGENPVAGDFASFADDLAAEGLAFLRKRLTAGKVRGPVLVSSDGNRIAGAIGPLSVMADAAGRPAVPSQYFAVHPDFRRQGHGRALWRTAAAWGQAAGAAYKVLQAKVGAPAEWLYVSEGLTTLGYVCALDV